MKRRELVDTLYKYVDLIKKKNRDIKEITELYKEQDKLLRLQQMRISQLEILAYKNQRRKHSEGMNELYKKADKGIGALLTDINKGVGVNAKEYWKENGIIF